MEPSLPRGAPSLLRITAEQLEAMAARGAFDRLPRIELREGLLYQMNPQHFPHGIANGHPFCGGLGFHDYGLPSTMRFSSSESVERITVVLLSMNLRYDSRVRTIL